MKAAAICLLLPLAANAQSSATPHQVLEKVKGIVLSEKTRDQVEAMLAPAVEGWEQNDPHSPEYANALVILGMIRQSRAGLDIYQLRRDVEPVYRKALTIYNRSFALADDEEMALALELQAGVLNLIGEVQDATPLHERAQAIRRTKVREMQEGARRIPAAYKSGNGITKPVATYKVEPEYTGVAQFLGERGTVKLRCVVDESGMPQDISLLESLGFGLDENAVRALRGWRFKPGEDAGGQIVPVIVDVDIDFHVPKA